MRPKAPSKRVERLLLAMEKGRVLCSGVTPRGGEGGIAYWLEPTGKRVGPDTARTAMAQGLVVPQGDGLFADAPQTWRLPWR
jgi:hypothetical protein